MTTKKTREKFEADYSDTPWVYTGTINDLCDNLDQLIEALREIINETDSYYPDAILAAGGNIMKEYDWKVDQIKELAQEALKEIENESN